MALFIKPFAGPAGAMSISAAVQTARMPGIDNASDASIPVKRACAIDERTNVRCNAPGIGKLPIYVPSPVKKRGSSIRTTRVPRMLMLTNHRQPQILIRWNMRFHHCRGTTQDVQHELVRLHSRAEYVYELLREHLHLQHQMSATSGYR